MRVFVTGASGHLASAVVPELIAAGHDVVGLARSDAAAAAVTALGASVHRGDLDDLDNLAQAAADSNGVIHLAFNHEQMRAGDYATPIRADLAVLRAIGDALAGTGKPLVGTSGTLALAHLGRTGPSRTRGAGWPHSTPRTSSSASRRGTCGHRSCVSRPYPQHAGHARLRPGPDRPGQPDGRGGLRRGRIEPVACRAHARRRPSLPAGPGGRPGRHPVACGRG